MSVKIFALLSFHYYNWRLMNCAQVIYSEHAVRRMFERNLSRQDVAEVLDNGVIIADYPDDEPYPSCLLLGFSRGRHIHVVVAVERPADKCYIITVYEPDPSIWESDFTTRKTT